MNTTNTIELHSKHHSYLVRCSSDSVSLTFSQLDTRDIEIAFASVQEMEAVANVMIQLTPGTFLPPGMDVVRIGEIHPGDPAYYYTIRVGPDEIFVQYHQVMYDNVTILFGDVYELEAVANAMLEVAAIAKRR